MTTSHHDGDRINPRVLIVDDETELSRMVAVCLQKSGFCTSTAEDSADAFHLLEQEIFDAIVTDVMMPGEDGIQFLGRVHNAWPDIPVILMTGHAQLQMAVDAIKNGAFDFVHKPFDFGHMCRIVERAVTYSKLQRLEKNYRAELEETVSRRTAELKDAMFELDFTRSALLKSATDKNEFMSKISHEMRTPMNGVVGGLNLLEDEVTTPDGKEYLKISRLSADNMVALIDQLLTFGNGNSRGGGGARYDLICLTADLNAVVEEYRPAFLRKGIALKLNVAPEVPQEIWTDKEHFKRLFGILLGNALKFTDQGAVTLDVSHENTDGAGGLLKFSVTDSGIGIPEGMLGHIFEPFVQGDGSNTRRHGGVGLGLAIARQNALILNGRLWAEHRPGGGSSFKFDMNVITP